METGEPTDCSLSDSSVGKPAVRTRIISGRPEICPVTVGRVIRVRGRDRDRATYLGSPTRRHGEGVASEGRRAVIGVVPVVTNPDEPATKTCLTRSASRPPSRDCAKERNTVSRFSGSKTGFSIPAEPVSVGHFFQTSIV